MFTSRVSYGFDEGGYVTAGVIDGLSEFILMFTFVFCSTFEDDVASDFGDLIFLNAVLSFSNSKKK